jgi:hypothetical protein
MYQSGEKVISPNERGWFVCPDSDPLALKKSRFRTARTPSVVACFPNSHMAVFFLAPRAPSTTGCEPTWSARAVQ